MAKQEICECDSPNNPELGDDLKYYCKKEKIEIEYPDSKTKTKLGKVGCGKLIYRVAPPRETIETGNAKIRGEKT